MIHLSYTSFLNTSRKNFFFGKITGWLLQVVVFGCFGWLQVWLVVKDVLGLEDVLENTFLSPWPWPRSLTSSKIVLPSARGQHYFVTVEILKFSIFNYNSVKTPETSRKICEHLFCFSQLEYWRSQGKQGPGPLPNRNFANDKNVAKKLIVSSVSISFQHFSLTTVTSNIGGQVNVKR